MHYGIPLYWWLTFGSCPLSMLSKYCFPPSHTLKCFHPRVRILMYRLTASLIKPLNKDLLCTFGHTLLNTLNTLRIPADQSSSFDHFAHSSMATLTSNSVDPFIIGHPSTEYFGHPLLTPHDFLLSRCMCRWKKIYDITFLISVDLSTFLG